MPGDWIMRAKGTPVVSGLVSALVLTVTGCHVGDTDGKDAGANVKITVRGAVDAGVSRAAMLRDRPYRRRAAPTPDGGAAPGTARLPPLLLALHGYGSSAAQIEKGLDLDDLADAHGYALAVPDGTPDSSGRRFWFANDSCCNFDDKPVDDVAYLGAVIDDATRRLGTDPARVYIVGHSAGGFMALRLACDIADKVTAVVSFAGAGYADATRCHPSRAVSVLQVHGDADTTIPYAGGTSPRLPEAVAFASAKDTIGAWGTYDRCSGVLTPAGKLDVTPDLPGAETDRARIAGCPTGLDVELWTVKGGEHNTQLSAAGRQAIGAFLDAAGRVGALGVTPPAGDR
jgi:polyhydroxybutyrate depolymerase